MPQRFWPFVWYSILIILLFWINFNDRNSISVILKSNDCDASTWQFLYWNLSLFSSLGKSQIWLQVEQQSSFLHLDNFHYLRGRLVSRTSIYLSHQACLEAFWDWPKKNLALRSQLIICKTKTIYGVITCISLAFYVSFRPDPIRWNKYSADIVGRILTQALFLRDKCFLWICQFYWKVFPFALRVISFPVLVLILVLIWINGWKTVDQKLPVL